jgi:hypothetical protein
MSYPCNLQFHRLAQVLGLLQKWSPSFEQPDSLFKV